MSLGEIVGLCLTIGLLGGLLGVALGVILERRGGDARLMLLERRRAIGRWAAARRTLNRAAGSFVAALRALGSEDRESPVYGLREQESQRARAFWCGCCRELDQAEAMLVALAMNGAAERCCGEAGADMRAIRAAIDGSGADAAAFFGRLAEEDRIVDATARERIRATSSSAAATVRIGSALAGCAEAIVERLSRRP